VVSVEGDEADACGCYLFDGELAVVIGVEGEDDRARRRGTLGIRSLGEDWNREQQ